MSARQFMDIGITGSTGVLGKILIKRLEKLRLRYSCYDGDICSSDDIETWIVGNKFSVIIHLAAIVSTINVKNRPSLAYEVNTIGTKKLLDKIKSSERNPWLFYASTSHVYKSKRIPIKELDPIQPISEYGKTKYEAEQLLRDNYKNLCVGRIFSFYHESQEDCFLYKNIMRRLKEEDLDLPFYLFGANSARDFLYADDVVEIIVALMMNKSKGIYNIGSGKEILIRDFVQKLSPKKLNIKMKGSDDYLVADISKLNKVLGK